jgi:hypothetical protein
MSMPNYSRSDRIEGLAQRDQIAYLLSLAITIGALLCQPSSISAAILDTPPVIVNCPESLTFNHCVQAVFEFQTADSELVAPTFVVMEGPGEFVVGCGFWVYNPTIKDVGKSQRLIIAAVDGAGGDIGPPDTVVLTFSNVKPQLTRPCDKIESTSIGVLIEMQVKGVSNDCDLPMYVVSAVSPLLPGNIRSTDTGEHSNSSPLKQTGGNDLNLPSVLPTKPTPHAVCAL